MLDRSDDKYMNSPGAEPVPARAHCGFNLHNPVLLAPSSIPRSEMVIISRPRMVNNVLGDYWSSNWRRRREVEVIVTGPVKLELIKPRSEPLPEELKIAKR